MDVLNDLIQLIELIHWCSFLEASNQESSDDDDDDGDQSEGESSTKDFNSMDNVITMFNMFRLYIYVY